MCDKKNFKYKSKLFDHLVTHSTEKFFHCEICNKSFKDKEYLRNHQKYHLTDKPSKCEICKKEYAYNHSLKSHFEESSYQFDD